METSLHRQLKEAYADADSRIEVPWGDYRIDVVSGDELIEIQHGSLAAIRDKVRRLTKKHRVLVVKPLVAKKSLIKLDGPQGKVISRRRSPKQATLLNLFDELVYFTRAFPHENLTLEVPLVEIEEYRRPGHGRRRRRRGNDFVIEDQKLVKIIQVERFQHADCLLRLLPRKLPRPFHTGDLAQGMQVTRWLAQRAAYCLREMGAAEQVGKQGNALLYELKKAA
jgi:hypothetical protein